MKEKRDFKGIWIPAEIWLSTELTLQEKVFLVEINSLDNDEGCFANNEYFAKFFGISKTRVSIVINKLVEKGFITSTIIYKEGTKQILKRVLKICYIGYIIKVKEGIKDLFKDNNTSNNTSNNTIEYKETEIEISELTPENSDVNLIEQDEKERKKKVAAKKKETAPAHDAPFFFEVTQILSLLQEKTGASYRVPDTAQKLFRYGPYQSIVPRIKEGYTLEDLIRVVESKCDEWLQSDKMCRYLTPNTLFCKKNFENYLTACSIKPSNKINNNENGNNQQQSGPYDHLFKALFES